jgi:hypothetical protein
VKEDNFVERRNAALAAKKALIEKSKAKANDPALLASRAEKASIKASNAVQRAERERLKREEDARKKAEDEARAIADAIAAKARLEEAAEKEAALKAEQKAERDRRYAARKNRKK